MPSGRIAYTAGAPPESSCTHSNGGCVWLAATPDTSLSTGSVSADGLVGRGGEAIAHVRPFWHRHP